MIATAKVLRSRPWQPARHQPTRKTFLLRAADVPDNGAQLSKRMRHAITLVLITILITPQLGINLGDTVISFTLPAGIWLVIAGLMEGVLEVRPTALLALLFVLAVAVFSFLFNSDSSLTSLLLLFVIYPPFALQSRTGLGRDYWLFSLRRFNAIIVFLTIVAIVQYLLLLVIHAEWLTAFNRVMPDVLRAGQHYNTIAYAGSNFRSNAYFLLEPSQLSEMSGIALLIEIMVFRRPLKMVFYVVGLMLALSGTGIFVLIVGMVVWIVSRLSVKMTAAAIFALAMAPVAANFGALSSLTGRLNEFRSPGSSGYARFVAPIGFVASGSDLAPWSLAFGNGPGSITRAIRASNSRFAIFDPTWAKAIFEYGLFGALGFAVLMGIGLFRRQGPVAFRVAMAYAWLFAGGFLLDPSANALVLVLIAFWRNDMDEGAVAA